MTDERVERAQTAAKAARERLMATAQEIQNRLEPSRLLDDALADVRERSGKAVQVASETVRERPGMIAGVLAAGIVLIGHRPLFRFGRRLIGKTEKHAPAPKARRTSKPRTPARKDLP